MNERDKATIEIIRASIRPILLCIMGIGALIFILCEIDSELARLWCYTFLGGLGELIIERPILKAKGKA